MGVRVILTPHIDGDGALISHDHFLNSHRLPREGLDPDVQVLFEPEDARIVRSTLVHRGLRRAWSPDERPPRRERTNFIARGRRIGRKRKSERIGVSPVS